MNEYAVEFDQLLHNYEYDNQQYVISIEKENQLIKDYSRDIDMTNLSIMKLQESISEMDESTKRIHKQFIMNRDNCISLKKTSTLLTEHFATLTKKLETFISKHKQETSENQKMLDHYWNIWKGYDAKYQSFSYVQDLENKMKEISLTESILNDRKEKKKKIVTNFADLQGSRQLTHKELQKFFVDLSKLKLNSIKQQINIFLLETKIKQKNKEKQEHFLKINSYHEEPESNKENIQPDVHLTPEEPDIPEKMDYECQEKVDNDYGPLQKLPSFESNANVSLQLGNSTITCGKNVQITKTFEKTSQSFHCGNLFKQPDVNFAKNQRNIALNTKLISHPPVRINNPIVPEDIMMSTKLSVSEITNTLPKAPAELPERTNIVMPSLHVPLIQNILLNQASPGNCSQLRKHDSDSKITTVPSVSVPVQNSSANVQVTQPFYHPPKKIHAAALTSSHFPSGTLQASSLPASKCNSNSSLITTPSKQPTLSPPQEITHISPVKDKGTFSKVLLDDAQKSFDFNEHKQFMKKFNSSPGAPALTQRLMFEHKDEMDNIEKVDEKKRVENPFFLQSFFTEQDEIKEIPGSVMSPARDFLSSFSGFNQNSENEITASQLDLGFNNSFGGSSTSETNFFSFGNDSGFTQPEESTSDFNFNFNSTHNSDNDNNTGFSLF